LVNNSDSSHITFLLYFIKIEY